MVRRSLAALALCLALLLCAGAALGESGENLIYNGSFEQLDSDGLPTGWYPDAYRMQEGYTVFSVSGEAQTGSRSACIENLTENDARFAQTVEVEPESLYRLSGWIRTEGEIEGGRGANLSVEGLYVFSEAVYDTQGGWQYVECYGETGEEQYDVTVFVRVGGYSGESKGKACFDGISLTPVDAVPGSGVASLWFSPASAALSFDDGDDEEDTDEDTAASPAWPRLLLLGLLFAGAVYLSSAAFGRDAAEEKKGGLLWFALGLAAAMALRMILAACVPGYAVDVGCFNAWGATFLQAGPGGFYETTSFCDYPPAYLWILGLNAWVCRGLQAGPALQQVIYRFVPCLCDLLSACLVYSLARQQGLRRRAAAVLGLLLAFNPAVLLNSAAWGQMDSVLCLLLLLTALLAVRRQWLPLMPVYMLAVLVKPQALMLGPLGLAAIVLDWIRHPGDRKPMLLGAACALALAAAVILPFRGGQPAGWLIERYAATLSSYPYATVNTANFHYLLGGNWAGIDRPANLLACLLPGLACAGTAFLLHFRWHPLDRKHPEPLILLLGAAVLLGLAPFRPSWGLVGGCMMALAFLLVLPLYLRGGDVRNLPLMGAVLFLLLYVMGVKMHERYLFPALFLLAMAMALTPDIRILGLIALTGFTVFVNEGIVLDNSIRLGSSMGHLNSDTLPLAVILSLLNVLSLPLGLWTVWDLAVADHPRLPALLPAADSVPEPAPRDDRLPWDRKDWLLVSAVTLVYAFAALCNLGSVKGPQHPWKSTQAEESVVFDLGIAPLPYHILYNAQVSYSDFTFAFSDDGETWSEPVWAEMREGNCWQWKYVTDSTSYGDKRRYGNEPLTFETRYVRVTAEQVGLILNEVLFRTEDLQVLPVKIAGRTGAAAASPLYSEPEALIDEPDTLDGEPGWYNSTYFDEIYHARTAYEHLQGTRPYETTHPPLGKLLMAASVAVFGMTPFGWRFAGAFTGILMLPAMYLLAKQLTKRRTTAFAAMSLMALDCMHFTQTRIATIDSYPVLFILLAFFFMLRFLQRDLLETPMKKLLPALGCSGLCMGLAIASKWTGCYAGAGLAVLYFAHCIQTLVKYRKKALLRVLFLCAWCVLFFVFVPALIYVLCYVPYFAYRKFTDLLAFLKAVVNAQIGMYNYHATPGLGMDHPYYSPWYEWLLIRRPMYYSMAYRVPEGWSYAIFCFGNPAVWLPGLAASLYVLGRCCWSHVYRLEGRAGGLHLRHRNGSLARSFVAIGFLAQLLPWVLVPRGTYIYHYFASVPFLILSLALLAEDAMRRFPRAAKGCLWALLAAALLCFIGFYPYASGVLTPTWWLDFMRHFLRIYY